MSHSPVKSVKIIALLLALVACSSKSYDKGGADWSDSACNPNTNTTVSPIIVDLNQTVCTTKYAVDYYFYDSGPQTVSIVYKGDPKTIRLTVQPTFLKLFLRHNSKILTFSLKEIVFRSYAEHQIIGRNYDAEGQFLFIADDDFGDEYPKELMRTVFYESVLVPEKETFFSGVVAALKNVTVDTMRFSNEKRPIPITFPPMGMLNKKNVRPLKFFAYYGTSTDEGCALKRLWILMDIRLQVSIEHLNFYRNYIEQLSGTSNNARTVVNTNSTVVYSCTGSCEQSFTPYLAMLMLYMVVLFVVHALT